MIAPSKNPITLAFGATESPYTASNPHKGTDFSYSPDKTIYMPEDGIVTLVPNNGKDGNGVYFTGKTGRHGLLHTSKYLVDNGQFVKEGTPVAIMGSTGYAFGVHLHWAFRVNGVYVDGMKYVNQGGNMAYIGDDELKDLQEWKLKGIDSQPYKDAVVAAGLQFGSTDELVAILKDLKQFKEDHQGSAANPKPLLPGVYEVK